MGDIGKNNIEDILLKAGLISSEKLESIKNLAEHSGEDVEKILLKEGITNYKEILKSKAQEMGVEFIDLENVSVDKRAISSISSDIAKKYIVFPFKIQGNLLFLAMQNPDDIFLIDEIKVFTQMEVKPFLADSRLINKAINYFYLDKGNNFVSKTAEINDKHISIDNFINHTIKSSLTPENITNITIDTEKRNIVVTLNIKY